MKNQGDRSREESLYRSVFKHSAVSLWLQDVTGLREIISEWKGRRIHDLRAYLGEHPEELRRAVHAIRVVDVNDATLEMYEAKEVGELLGPLDRTLDLEDADVVETLTDNILAIFEGREHLNLESRAIAPSGRRLDVAIDMYLPPDTSQFPLMLVNVSDITDRKRLERGLEWERHQFHMLLDSAVDRIYFKDRERRFTIVNQSVAEGFGVSTPEELVGQTSDSFLSPELAEEVRREEIEIIETGKAITDREQVERTPDGRERWFSTNKAPLRDAEGRIVGIVGITRDITINKLLEEERGRIQGLEGIGQLASGIAHRFNNINAAAMGYLEMVMRSPTLPQNLRGYLVNALEAILSSADITSSLQVLTGAVISDKSLVRLETIANGLLAEIEEQAQQVGADVSTSFAETSPVLCSPASMEFVVRSVVSNALHALLECENPEIRIRSYTRDERSYLEIADTGRGIPVSDTSKLFVPFYTTKGEWAETGSPQAKVKGLGLSLSVCRSLVSEQAGIFEIDSVEGSGTTVRIAMPIAGGSATRTA